jgi:hypothetical protein
MDAISTILSCSAFGASGHGFTVERLRSEEGVSRAY